MKTLAIADQIVAGWIRRMSLDLPEDFTVVDASFDEHDNVVLLLESEEFPEVPEGATPEEIGDTVFGG